MVKHYHLVLDEYKRGFHLVTEQILQAVGTLPQNGLMTVFIQHTSASLSINENADSSVRRDLERYFNHAVPEDTPYFEHIYEGSDDMPAHVKAGLLGSNVSVPIIQGALGLGTWQGIYLGEHRNHGGQRRLIISIVD